jgi:hypothetical protein
MSKVVVTLETSGSTNVMEVPPYLFLSLLYDLFFFLLKTYSNRELFVFSSTIHFDGEFIKILRRFKVGCTIKWNAREYITVALCHDLFSRNLKEECVNKQDMGRFIIVLPVTQKHLRFYDARKRLGDALRVRVPETPPWQM